MSEQAAISIETLAGIFARKPFNHVRLRDAQNNTLVHWGRQQEKIDTRGAKVIEKLKNEFTTPGTYYVDFKDIFSAKAFKTLLVTKDGEMKTTPTTDSSQQILSPDEVVNLRVEVERLKLENKALQEALDSDGELEEGADPAEGYAKLAETLSPLVERFLDIYEKRALAAAPRAIPTRQAVSRTPINRPAPPPGPQAAQPQAPATPGAAGGSQPEAGDDQDENTYIGQVMTASVDDLGAHYRQLIDAGDRVGLKYFLAVLRDYRPEQFKQLVDHGKEEQQPEG